MIEPALVFVEDLAFVSALRHYPVMMFVDVLRVTSAFGLGLAVVCGALLFATAAADYAGSGIFRVKMALVLLGVSNALLSLVVWVSALILGRLLGYF